MSGNRLGALSPTPASSAAPSASCSTARCGSASRPSSPAREGPLAPRRAPPGCGRRCARTNAAAARLGAAARPRPARRPGARGARAGGAAPAPHALVAWGARAVLAAALSRGGRGRRCWPSTCDLPPRRAVAHGGAAGHAARRRRAAASRGDRGGRGAARDVLHPGVDLGRFAALPAPPAPPRALVLGALVPWKRPDLALEVAARVPGAAARARRSADPRRRPTLRRGAPTRAPRRATSAGRVTFLGPLADPRERARRARTACCTAPTPSRRASRSSRRSPPAGRSSRPTAAGPREIVADGAGRLFPPGDAAAAAAALRGGARRPGGAGRRASTRASASRSRRRRRGSGPRWRRPVTVQAARYEVVPEVAARDVHGGRLARLRARAARAAALARAPPAPRRRSSSSSTAARATAAPRSPRAHGAEVVALPATPASAPRATPASSARATTSRSCSTPTASCSTLARRARRARPRAIRDALHAPRLLNADGSVQRSVHPLPGTPGTLLPALVHPAAAAARAARARRAAPRRHARARSAGRSPPAWPRTTATLRRLGPFDPAVHLFAEDMELCLRARAAGIPTVLHPELRLRHAGGHATLRAGEPYELLARRRREAIGRHARPPGAGARRPRAGAHVRHPRRRPHRARRRRRPAARAARRAPARALRPTTAALRGSAVAAAPHHAGLACGA